MKSGRILRAPRSGGAWAARAAQCATASAVICVLAGLGHAQTPSGAPSEAEPLPPGVQSGSDVEARASLLSSELDGVGRRVDNLERDVGAAWLDKPRAALERRFVDAQVFFDLGHFEKASVLLYDVVESTLAQQSSSLSLAYWLLAQSLRATGNFRAAEHSLEALLALGPENEPQVLAALVDNALDMQSEAGLSRALELIQARGATSHDAVHARGKALFHLGRHGEASAAFGRIPSNAPQFGAARYYLGVIATAQRDFAVAVTRFDEALAASLVDADGSAGAFAELRDQSNLALGRLWAEQGQLDRSVASYERVERSSTHFETAMLEMAWAQANMGAMEDCRNTLEILLMVSEQPKVRAEAAVLRGRVLEAQGRAEGALEVFEDVVTELGPLRRELSSVADSGPRLQQYFQWLLERRSAEFPMPSPLSPSAEAFVDPASQTGRVLAAVDSVGQQLRDLEWIDDTLEQLEAALQNQKPVDIFPELQDAWLRAMEQENSLLLIHRGLLDLEHALHAMAGPSEQTPQAAARRALEARFLREVPQTVADYQQRAGDVLERIETVEGEIDAVKRQLKALSREIGALETWMAQGRQVGASDVTPALEQQLASELALERLMVDAVRQSLGEAERNLEVERARSGVAQVQPLNSANVKNELLELQLADHDDLARRRNRLSARALARAESLAALRSDTWKRIGQVGEIVRLVEGRVGRQAEALAAVLAQERAQLAQWKSDVDAVAETSRDLAASAGKLALLEARRTVGEYILDADAGILDAVWRRKEVKAEDLRNVQDRFGQRLEEIGRALEEIEAEEQDEAAEFPGAPGPAAGGEGDE